MDELDVLRHELAWLLGEDFPAVLADICKKLERCLVLTDANTNDNGSSLALSSTNDVLKGFIHLKGHEITKGELNIKLASTGKGAAFKERISGARPYSLDQLQTARNYTILASREANAHSADLTNATKAKMLLENISKYSKQGKIALSQTSQDRIFPHKVCYAKAFEPELPEDVVVEFRIQDGNVICFVAALDFHPSLPARGSRFGLSTQAKPANRVIQYKDKYALITDQVVIEANSPSIQELQHTLRQIEDICLQHIKKLSLFEPIF